ncbi:hypothetical protein Slin15195_G100830 [Septoria linicola]|uniref:Uncharacterized protein n=1 Tax=Septoria linicola TaxID=215465 RepID=A0A9Q9AWK3_9PEZI|nr:hypothetical protein Slin14017_G063850 [Septoria linicola]USW56764.1 hypothetical protein Slin15195_G100830 [Septoria linicola]
MAPQQQLFKPCCPWCDTSFDIANPGNYTISWDDTDEEGTFHCPRQPGITFWLHRAPEAGDNIWCSADEGDEDAFRQFCKDYSAEQYRLQQIEKKRAREQAARNRSAGHGAAGQEPSKGQTSQSHSATAKAEGMSTGDHDPKNRASPARTTDVTGTGADGAAANVDPQNSSQSTSNSARRRPRTKQSGSKTPLPKMGGPEASSKTGNKSPEQGSQSGMRLKESFIHRKDGRKVGTCSSVHDANGTTVLHEKKERPRLVLQSASEAPPRLEIIPPHRLQKASGPVNDSNSAGARQNGNSSRGRGSGGVSTGERRGGGRGGLGRHGAGELRRPLMIGNAAAGERPTAPKPRSISGTLGKFAQAMLLEMTR